MPFQSACHHGLPPTAIYFVTLYLHAYLLMCARIHYMYLTASVRPCVCVFLHQRASDDVASEYSLSALSHNPQSHSKDTSNAEGVMRGEETHPSKGAARLRLDPRARIKTKEPHGGGLSGGARGKCRRRTSGVISWPRREAPATTRRLITSFVLRLPVESAALWVCSPGCPAVNRLVVQWVFGIFCR